MPIELDRGRIEEIVRALGDRLDGEWVLLGGALTAIWLLPRRVTEDIDIVSLAGSSGDRLTLMLAAEELGLPVEAVNSAADFFLERIPGWRNRLELHLEGRSARIYRPDPTLFLLLKSRRLSEQDLADCRAMLQKVEAEGLLLDRRAVLECLGGLDATDDEALSGRRAELDAMLGQGPR